MVEQENVDQRCRQAVEELNRREGWNLTGNQAETYIKQIKQWMPDDSLTAQLDQVVRYFHQEHQLITALQDEQSVQHHQAWAWVDYEIMRVAKIRRLDWSSDQSVEHDDLIQSVRVEVARSLGRYRFESSLRTWLQQVTIRRLSRLHRDNTADKRAVRPGKIEDAEGETVEWSELEHLANAKALLDEIKRILNSQPDKRLIHIFYMSVVEDWSTEEIGRKLQLHPSRIRALLKYTRDLLRQDRSLQLWRTSTTDNDPDDARDESLTGTI